MYLHYLIDMNLVLCMNLVLTSENSKNPIFGIKFCRLLVSVENENQICTFLSTNIHFILTLFPNLSICKFCHLIPNSAVHINKIELPHDFMDKIHNPKVLFSDHST